MTNISLFIIILIIGYYYFFKKNQIRFCKETWLDKMYYYVYRSLGDVYKNEWFNDNSNYVIIDLKNIQKWINEKRYN